MLTILKLKKLFQNISAILFKKLSLIKKIIDINPKFICVQSIWSSPKYTNFRSFSTVETFKSFCDRFGIQGDAKSLRLSC